MDGGQPGCFARAFEMGLGEPISFLELGRFVVRDYGTCEGTDLGSGFMSHKTKSDEVSSHHYFHDISIRGVNKATPNGESATIIHSLFNGGYLKWAAWENEEILDASGYSYRGSSGDSGVQAGPYRFQGTTRTCFANGINLNTGTLCTGRKLRSYTSEVEIIDQIFDMNMDAGWTLLNSIANGFASVVQCMQDVVVRNNLAIDVKTMVGMNGFDDGACNPAADGIPSRSTKNIRIEGNVWCNTYDWARGSRSDGTYLNVANCEGFNRTIEDVTITNNFCSSTVPMNMMVYLNCRQDDGENPGSYRMSGNTFVAEAGLDKGIIRQSTPDGGAFGEDDIEFRDNIVVAPPGQTAMFFQSTVANLNSDYNTFAPGVEYRWAGANLGSSLAAWQATTGGDAASADCVPDFVDRPSGDLHLDPSDPCAIDWGTSISNVTLGDIDGDARPQGTDWDIGADEVADGTPPPTDITPPARANGAPTGTLPAGTIQAVISLNTNEVAACRYDTVAGTAYVDMPIDFTGTNATQHSTSVGGLTDGGSFSYFVRCIGGAGNANLSDFVISFDVEEDVDIEAPTISIDPVPNPTQQVAVALGGSAADNVGVTEIEWTNGATGDSGFATGCASATDCTWSTGDIALNVGDNLIIVTARDAAGNATGDNVTVMRTLGDQTPPVISALSARAQTGDTVTVTVTWTTDEPATSAVECGTTAAYGAVETVSGLRTSHTVTIDCLDRKTIYHFRALSADGADNLAVSGNRTIRTSGKRPRGSCPG